MNNGLDHPEKEDSKPARNANVKADDKSNIIEDTSTKAMDPRDFQTYAYAHVTDKYEGRNFERYVQSQRKQCEEMARRHKAVEQQALKERRLDEDNNLARELEVIKREEFKEAKLRQQLRENCHELRDLERKLKAAYVNKVLAAQIAQKEAAKLNEKIHNAKAYDVMTKAWITEKEHLNHIKHEEVKKKASYKKELQDQVIMKEKSKRYLYEEFLREKKLLDDVVKRIHDEDEKLRFEKMCKTRRTQQEIKNVQEAQRQWKQKRLEEIEAEDKKIEDYLLLLSTQKNDRAIARAEKEAERQKMLERMALDVAKMRETKKEREDIVQDLMEEELSMKQDKRHKDELEKKLKQKLKLRTDLVHQIQDVEEKRKNDQEEERKYKEQILAKMVEDEKLEQLSAQKKRLKLIRMRKDVEQLLIERRAKHAEEFQLQIGIEEEEKREADRRRQIIEEERIKILNEHVQNLIGYLPKGLLKAEDLPHLSSDIVQNFQTSNPLSTYIPPVHRKR